MKYSNIPVGPEGTISRTPSGAWECEAWVSVEVTPLQMEMLKDQETFDRFCRNARAGFWRMYWDDFDREIIGDPEDRTSTAGEAEERR